MDNTVKFQNCALLATPKQISPQKSQDQLPPQPTTPRPLKDNKIKVALIIEAIILLIAVLAVFFIFFPEPEEEIETPKGYLSFTEDPEISGKYYGRLVGCVQNKNIKIELFDTSLDQTTTMNEPEHMDIVQIPGGCNLTYIDTSANKKQDGSDILLIQGGEHGDWITIVYKPTDEVMATATLP